MVWIREQRFVWLVLEGHLEVLYMQGDHMVGINGFSGQVTYQPSEDATQAWEEGREGRKLVPQVTLGGINFLKRLLMAELVSRPSRIIPGHTPVLEAKKPILRGYWRWPS